MNPKPHHFPRPSEMPIVCREFAELWPGILKFFEEQFIGAGDPLDSEEQLLLAHVCGKSHAAGITLGLMLADLRSHMSAQQADATREFYQQQSHKN